MAIEALKNHQWPGNIRELRNVVIRAAAYFPGKRIQEDDLIQLIDLPTNSHDEPWTTDSDIDLPPLKEIEKNLIVTKLQKHFGNQRKVAEDLKMPKSTLHDKLKTYRIDPSQYKKRGRV